MLLLGKKKSYGLQRKRTCYCIEEENSIVTANPAMTSVGIIIVRMHIHGEGCIQ